MGFPGSRQQPLHIRARLKRVLKPPLMLLKPFLWRPGLLALRYSTRRAGLVLLYHDVADRDGDPRLELVPPVSRARFAHHLSHLTRYYRIVQLEQLPRAVTIRRRGEPFPIALSFDDDLGHHVTHALPELEKVDATATFFLCGSFLDEPRDYWWQRLQRSIEQGVDVDGLLGSGSIHEKGLVMEAFGPGRRDSVADELLALAGPAPEGDLLTSDAAKRLPHIGFHTTRHDPLTGIDDDQLVRALTHGRTELAEFAGYPITTIAYPHGQFDSRVIAVARECNFGIGLTCERKAVTPTSDPLTLGRYEPRSRGSIGDFAFDLVRTLLMSGTG